MPDKLIVVVAFDQPAQLKLNKMFTNCCDTAFASTQPSVGHHGSIVKSPTSDPTTVLPDVEAIPLARTA